MLDVDRWDVPALAAAWARAAPFPHVVIDDVLAEPTFAALKLGAAQEPHGAHRTEIVDALASSPTPAHPTLIALGAALRGAPVLAAIEAVSGKRVTEVDVRSYVYVAGCYLLPHTDNRSDLARQVAFALYLDHDAGCAGGDLELFECTTRDGDIVATAPHTTIAYRPNRLVLFDVSDVSLHQIREVTEGARVSVTGWFR